MDDVVVMRGGGTVWDPRLGRVPQFDERSRQFGIRAAIEAKHPRSYTWSCAPRLDQGSEGACVGFAWAHELAARPAVVPATEGLARSIYHEAQRIDEWAGEDYEGTSVLAGAKATMARGHLKEYRWAFGLADLVLAVGYAGPAVLGTWWHEGMFDAGECGWLHVTGDRAGGHAYLVNGVSVPDRTFTVHNSWGPTWGTAGEAKIGWDDMERLLHDGGEACVPIARVRPRS